VLTGHGCFQSYFYKRARAISPTCLQCRGGEDTVEHTLFECYCWTAIQDIICGPPFDHLQADPEEKSAILRNAEESFRLFYGMVKRIFSNKEEEERVWQAVEVRR